MATKPKDPMLPEEDDEAEEGETIQLEDVDNDVEEHDDGSATITLKENTHGHSLVLIDWAAGGWCGCHGGLLVKNLG